MVPISYKASAPGTLMLLGEHAVLRNKKALVLAVDKRVHVTLTPRTDRHIIINSALGIRQLNLDNLKIEQPFQFVSTAISHLKNQLSTGFELMITSEFKEDVGFGSSAAVTVATLMVLYHFMKAEIDSKHLMRVFADAKAVIQVVQGVGSGADVAASVFGGIVLYQQNSPWVIKQWAHLLPLVAIYSGSKIPTPEVVKKVEAARQKKPEVYEKLYDSIEACVNEAVVAIEQEDWPLLGEILTIQQGLMNALGVGTPLLNRIIDKLNGHLEIFGSKISGSGLGDCVIGIGQCHSFTMAEETAVREITVRASLQGAYCE